MLLSQITHFSTRVLIDDLTEQLLGNRPRNGQLTDPLCRCLPMSDLVPNYFSTQDC